jgi:hypothetical protein
MSFFKRKTEQPSEQNTIIELKRRLNQAENDILDINITLAALKGKILKKIQNKKPDNDDETQNLYNSILIKET